MAPELALFELPVDLLHLIFDLVSLDLLFLVTRLIDEL
jgi:hypothetical protein